MLLNQKKQTTKNKNMGISPQQRKFMQNMVNSASPEQLIILLYNGALQWLSMAKNEIQKNKELTVPSWGSYSHQMSMTQDIIVHLQDSLNHDVDPKFAEDLFSLYDYLKAELLKANIDKDAGKIDLAIKILTELKEGWTEGIKNLNKK
jgi:flagellar protein FliS